MSNENIRTIAQRREDALANLTVDGRAKKHETSAKPQSGIVRGGEDVRRAQRESKVLGSVLVAGALVGSTAYLGVNAVSSVVKSIDERYKEYDNIGVPTLPEDPKDMVVVIPPQAAEQVSQDSILAQVTTGGDTVAP